MHHDGCPAGKPVAVVKETDGALVACHETVEKAKAQQRALYASEDNRG